MQNQNEKISRYCGRGPRVQGFYKEKTTLLNRLDPGYPAGRPSGMTTRSAFTLIELLVVVLIIGILAAVAVPQYQKAILKARYAQLKIFAHSLVNAEEIYYMANGKYTHNFDDLDIQMPPATTSHCQESSCYWHFGTHHCKINNTANRAEVWCYIGSDGKEIIAYHRGFHLGSIFADESHCIAFGDTEKPTTRNISYQVCRNETNKANPISWGERAFGFLYPTK